VLNLTGINYSVSTNTKQEKQTQRQHRQTDKKEKLNSFRLIKFKQKFLKLTVSLKTALATETHLVKGQCLKGQLNIEKLHMFRAGT
jgi:hypothetical protein